MKTVLHLMRHDLHVHRRLLGIWLAVLAIHPLAHLLVEGSRSAMTGGLNVPFLTFALVHVTRVLTMALIVGRLVHADGPSSPDAFWRTRPLAPRLLATQKLMLIYALFVGVPLFIVGAAAIAAGVGQSDIGWMLGQVALAESVLVGIALVAAAATTRTSTMLLTALAAVAITPWTVALLGETVRHSTLHARVVLPGVTGPAVAHVVLALAGLLLAAIACRLYHVGREGRLRLGVLTAAGVTFLTVLSNTIAPVRVAADADDAPVTATFALDRTRVDEMEAAGEWRVVITAVPVVSGLRPDERAQVSAHEMTLRTTDGRVIASRATRDVQALALVDSEADALTLMQIDAKQAQTLSGTTASIEGSVTVEVVRHQELARVPFTSGQRVHVEPYSMRLGATRAEPGPDPVMVTAVKVTEQRPWFESRPWQRVDWHLVTRDGRTRPVVAHLDDRLPPVLLPTVSPPFAWERRVLRWVGGVGEASVATGDVELVAIRVGLARRSRHRFLLEGVRLP